MSAVLVWFATDVAVLFLGDQYLLAGPVVQILFLGVAMRSLIKLGDAVVRALDSLVAATFIKLGFLMAIGGTAWYAMNNDFGILGVAWGVTVATAMQFIAMAVLVIHITQWTTPSALRSLWAGILALLLTAAGCWGIATWSEYLFSEQSGTTWHLFRVALSSAWGLVCMLFVAQKTNTLSIGKPLEWLSGRSGSHPLATTDPES